MTIRLSAWGVASGGEREETSVVIGFSLIMYLAKSRLWPMKLIQIIIHHCKSLMVNQWLTF